MAIQKQDERQGNGGRGQQNVSIERRQNQQQMSARAARTRPFYMMRRMLDDLDSMGSYGMVSPFSSMRRMFEELERLVDADVGGEIEAGGGDVVWAPRIEVIQSEDKVLVRADVPGVARENIHVNTEGDLLIIDGEREALDEKQQGGVVRSEYQRGEFRRVIGLPQGAEVDKAEARYENGVLEVTVPIAAQQSRGRQIQIQSRAEQNQPSPQIKEPAKTQPAPESLKH